MDYSSVSDEKVHEFIKMLREIIDEDYSVLQSIQDSLAAKSTEDVVKEISSHFASTAKSILISGDVET